MGRHAQFLWVALIALGLVAPLVVYPIFLMKVLCFGLFASAFNLLIGYGGLMSFGHAMFFGTASYLAAHALKVWGWPMEAGIAVAVLAAAALGLVSGALAIRREGIYFAMITLAIAQMMFFFYLQAPFTGGEDGIQSVPRGKLLGLISLEDDRVLYYFIFGCFVAAFWLIHRVVHSPFGQALKAIRENEQRAISLGYSVNHYKLTAFVLSATLAGLAGALKVLVFQIATLTDVSWTMSGEVVLMTLVGGMGTIVGPLVGAGVVVAMQNYLAGLGEWVLIVQGLLFMLVVLVFRRGIVGEIMVRRARAARSSDDALPYSDAVPPDRQ
jgi:branched-chain amino acid transport system permease protein